MPQKSIRQALSEALRQEMRRDATVAVGGGEMLAGASMRRAELHQDDLRVIAGSRGQASVARQ
jgi:pyruvate/2-oxoglutarate/acetoin dehydrogenase E1 component